MARQERYSGSDSRGRSRQTSERQTEESRIVSEESIKKIIQTDNPDELIKKAEELGKKLASERLKTASVRNFFGMVRQMQSQEVIRRRNEGQQEQISDATHRDLLLMIPKLRYQSQRGLDGVKRLADELEPAIKAIERDPKAFSNFLDFFEAILAYHKAAGGAE